MEAVIGTHSGPFHGDDVMSCAMLKIHPLFKHARIERSRDMEVLDKCDIVVDVGGKFSHQDRRYDHHQRYFDVTMDELSKGEIKSDVKVSSAGLVYFYYGREIIKCLVTDPEVDHSDKAKTDWIWKKIYFNLIKEIDYIDNHGSRGESFIKTGFSNRVGRLGPDWDDETPDYDKHFQKAVNLATREFMENVQDVKAQYRAKLALKEKIVKRKDDHSSGKVLIFGKYTSWMQNMHEVENEEGIRGEILFVVNPSTEPDEFSVSAVFNRISLPVEWRGLSEKDLQRAGLKNVKFVHSNGHFAVLKSKEAAISVLDQLLDNIDSTHRRQKDAKPLKEQENNWRGQPEVSRTGESWRMRGDGRGEERLLAKGQENAKPWKDQDCKENNWRGQPEVSRTGKSWRMWRVPGSDH